MQVKPRFQKYKLLSKSLIVTDDTKNKMCLCKFEALLPSDEFVSIETPYTFWIICGDRQEIYGNKAVGYDTTAYWNCDKKDLIKTTLNGFLIEEIEDGKHRLFGENMFDCSVTGLRTKFKLTKLDTN